jgi:hypothetical protein
MAPRRTSRRKPARVRNASRSLFNRKSAWPRVSITKRMGMSSVVVTCYSPPPERLLRGLQPSSQEAQPVHAFTLDASTITGPWRSGMLSPGVERELRLVTAARRPSYGG